MDRSASSHSPEPWNKGKLVGQKAPLRVKDIWAIRVRLQMQERIRDLALFDLGIDSKLRACDLVRLRVSDVCHGDRLSSRAMVLQQKTQRPVQFEITPATREAVEGWIWGARKPNCNISYRALARLHRPHHFDRIDDSLTLGG